MLSLFKRLLAKRMSFFAFSTLFLLFASWNFSYACDFVGVTCDKYVTEYPDKYWMTMERLPWLAVHPYGGGMGDDDGWSVTWYGRVNEPVYSDSVRFNYERNITIPEYERLYMETCELAFWDQVPGETNTVIAHARAVGNDNEPPPNPTQSNDHGNPHPFIYDHLFGKTYSTVHNGKMYWPSGTPYWHLYDPIGVHFCSLPIFNSRYFTDWCPDNEHEPNHAIDSEYWTMLIMKYFLIQNNCYWAENHQPLPIESPLEWAIHMAAKDYVIVEQAVTSLNSLITDGSEMWLLHKSDNVHWVSYNDRTPNIRMVSTDRDPMLDMEWTPLENNMVLRLTPHNELEPHALLERPDFPEELRVNEPGVNSNGDQTSPAISVNPEDGSFVVVWVSNNIVKGRWYNQMGLAEAGEFTVSTHPAGYIKASPAIAHNPHGDSITVVWVESDELNGTAFRRIEVRSFGWNAENKTWTGSSEFTTVHNTGTTGDMVLHPTIAYSPVTFGYAIAWEHTVLPPNYHHEIRVAEYFPGGLQTFEQVIEPHNPAQFHFDYMPDIVYLGNSVFAISYHGQLVNSQILGVALFREDLNPMLTEGFPITDNGRNTSVARMNNSQMVVAYVRNNQLRANLIDVIDRSTVHSAQTFTGAAISGTAYPDVAVKETDGTFFICYENSVAGSNGYNVYCTRRNGSLLTAPQMVNTTQWNDQNMPVMAISQSYNDFYHNNTEEHNRKFDVRRMIIWQTRGQDIDGFVTTTWGIAGKFHGIDADNGEYHWFKDEIFPDDPHRLVQHGISAPSISAQNANKDKSSTIVSLPLKYMLSDAYPNPFNPTTTIRYAIPEAAHVQLGVFDINGRLVAQLVNQVISAGEYHAAFDGSALPTGMYFIRMQAGPFNSMKKMLLLK